MKRFIPLVVFVLAGPVMAAAPGHFYVGGSLGFTSADIDMSDPDAACASLASIGVTCSTGSDDNSGSLALVAGWRFHPYVGIEAGYWNLGEYERRLDASGFGSVLHAEEDTTIDGIFGSILGYAPFGAKVSGFGRVGLYNWVQDIEFTVVENGLVSRATDDESGSSALFGLGVELRPHHRTTVRFEVNRFVDVGDDDKAWQGNIDTVNASVLFNF